jgi:hypothetical protein
MFMQRIVTALALLLLFAGAAGAAKKEGGSSSKKEAKSSQKKDAKKGVAAPKSDVTESIRVGRYQLLYLDYAINDQINETMATKKELVLLDTATGRMKVCSQKSWLNVADAREIAERKCLPFETYAEYPMGTLKGRKVREGELSRP